MFQLVVLCGLLAVTVGQLEGRGCCAPQQWEARVNQVASVKSKFGYGKISSDQMTLSYDFKNQRVREDITFLVPGGRPTATYIFDFRGRKAYRINSKTRSCSVFKLRSKLLRYCVPANAQLFANLFYGSGNNRLDFRAYGFRIDRRHSYVASSVAVDGCVPIEDTVTGPQRSGTYVGVINYGNITAGIQDPSIFNPPKFCHRVAMDFQDLEEEPLDRFLVDYIHSRIME